MTPVPEVLIRLERSLEKHRRRLQAAYPNAGKRWTPEDEASLLDLWAFSLEKDLLAEAVVRFGRTRESIRTKLAELQRCKTRRRR